jgi:FAD/FMN-containing dehydrogenase
MELDAQERRRLLKIGAAIPLLPGVWNPLAAVAQVSRRMPMSRVRLADPGWPAEELWQRLGQDVRGALIKVRSPLTTCTAGASAHECEQFFRAAKNPYYLGEEVGLTQTLGWVDAWTSRPSVYAVAARSAGDVVAAVNFARQHNLRLVVKGGGHSYQGTSSAPDSLLIWTRRMDETTLHDSFTAQGCTGRAAPVRAVSVGAGAVWAQVYDAVTTRGGGYVQGGGCMTVGVAGLVQSGGFGSFSKAFGLAASGLLEAEVVTADGAVRVANACVNPDLFWALKGGGGGSLGVVTRLTLKVHELPDSFGAVNMTIKATSAPAFRRLIGMVVDFYARSLMNPHWGEQIRFRSDDSVNISMVFQGLDRGEAQAIWQPFMDAVDASPELKVEFSPLKIVSTSARSFWSPTLFKRLFGFISTDDRPGASPQNVFWPGDQRQAGQVLYAYQSAWLPAALLQAPQRQLLCDSLFAATRHWGMSLHVNKGLAGAPPDVLRAAQDTAMNPAVLGAFALAVCGAEGPPAYPGIPGHEQDLMLARRRAQLVARAMGEIRKLVPDAGSYVSESDFFQPNWQWSFWGSNYSRLLGVKRLYDPQGLFFVRHGVGSEEWSADGFTWTG